MGSEKCRRHLQNLTSLLVKFGKEPKKIEGRKITNWFRIGEEIFEEFFEAGRSVAWRYAAIREEKETSNVRAQITLNHKWLVLFINVYPNFRIDLDLVGSADSVCKVRSGIEVFLKGLAGSNDTFDNLLRDIGEEGEIEELDRCLKLWAETGHRPDFSKKPSNLNGEHWWWF
ncbi:unnamed protein product [Leptosia nina]|uniref:Uncharacterized protein n=1 Tax=Leptosia nina TaxID=320188 RepID=A0AAV1JQM6_9NEOP